MVQNDKTPVAPLPATSASEQQKILALINKRFPEKSGFIRRIRPVFNNYFRINFQDTAQCNYVSESHFINVEDDKITELN